MSETSPEVEKLMTNAVRARPKATASDKISKVEAPEEATKEGPKVETLDKSPIESTPPPTPETTENTNDSQGRLTDEQQIKIEKLYKQLGRHQTEYAHDYLYDPRRQGDNESNIYHLKRDVAYYTNEGLRSLERIGITKHHLLEKGIKNFKINLSSPDSRIIGNTLILGKNHHSMYMPDKNHLKSLHYLLDSNKKSHASSQALSKGKEMLMKATKAKIQGKPHEAHIDAAIRWNNMARLLKEDPKQGLEIIKELKSGKKPSKERLDFLSNLYKTPKKSFFSKAYEWLENKLN